MNINTNQSINVGVDTGKTQLDIYIRPLDIYLSVTNDDEGIKHAIKEIKKHCPERIVIEATGRLEFAFAVACKKAKLPISIINPAHIKKFAGAIGRLAKTDKLDAQLIAHYSEAIKPAISELRPETMQFMSDLLARRKQLITMQTMEKNRLKILPKTLHKSINAVLKLLMREIEKVDVLMNKTIEDCPKYQAKNVFKSTYQQLVEQGKPKKVAIIACLRKMIVILNSMLRDGVMWDENMAKIQ